MRSFTDHIQQIPIPAATLSQQKTLVTLVERILKTKQGEGGNPVCPARNGKEADKIVCSTIEREIDQQVYALYRLTPEEIKIVEESTK